MYSSKFSHITPIEKKTPIQLQGIQFKIGLITYKILKHGEPTYLCELIHPTPLLEIQKM